MTRSTILRASGCGALWLLLAGIATAQYNPFPGLNPGTRFAPYARNSAGYVPSSGPRLSPYLNLLRGGNPAANYYLGVVPEIERRRFESQAIAGFRSLEQQVESQPAEGDVLFPRLSQTGHPVQFMNPAPYYNTGNGRPGGQSPQMFQSQARPRR